MKVLFISMHGIAVVISQSMGDGPRCVMSVIQQRLDGLPMDGGGTWIWYIKEDEDDIVEVEQKPNNGVIMTRLEALFLSVLQWMLSRGERWEQHHLVHSAGLKKKRRSSRYLLGKKKSSSAGWLVVMQWNVCFSTFGSFSDWLADWLYEWMTADFDDIHNLVLVSNRG